VARHFEGGEQRRHAGAEFTEKEREIVKIPEVLEAVLGHPLKGGESDEVPNREVANDEEDDHCHEPNHEPRHRTIRYDSAYQKGGFGG